MTGGVTYRSGSGLISHIDLFDVARGGFEPPTFRFSGGRSYRLSYLASGSINSHRSGAITKGS